MKNLHDQQAKITALSEKQVNIPVHMYFSSVQTWSARQAYIGGGGGGGGYLKTGPDPIAMVIRVELFIHQPCRQMPPVTYLCLSNHAVPTCICLAGLVGG